MAAFGRQELTYKADEFFVQFQLVPKDQPKEPDEKGDKATQITHFDPLDDPAAFERSQVPEDMDIV